MKCATSKPMDDPTRKRLERQLRELHEYGRHVIACLVAFFIPFMTVNIILLDCSVNEVGADAKPDWSWLVSLFFIGLCGVAGFGIWLIRVYLKALNADIEMHTAALNHGVNLPPTFGRPPRETALFSIVTLMMIFVIGLMGVAWLGVPFLNERMDDKQRPIPKDRIIKMD